MLNNNTLLVNEGTSQTQSNSLQMLQLRIDALKQRKYSEQDLNKLHEMGISDKIIQSFKECSSYYNYKMSFDNKNQFLFMKSCKKRGCPVCSKSSLDNQLIRYSDLFKGFMDVRVFTYTWKDPVKCKKDVVKRQLNLKALDKRLQRYGYQTKQVLRSVEWSDNEKEMNEGIHYHIHEVRKGDIVDITKQPFRYIVIKDKEGIVLYKGNCGLFQKIENKIPVDKYDGYINVYVLSKIWEEITKGSKIVYAQYLYDKEKALKYVLKYVCKPFKFNHINNLYLYLSIFRNCKSVYYMNMKNNEKIKNIKTKILNLDDEKPFVIDIKRFVFGKTKLIENRLLILYVDKVNKKELKRLSVINYSDCPYDYLNDRIMISMIDEKILNNKESFEKQFNFHEIERIFTIAEINKMLSEGIIYEDNRGYHLL